MPASVINSMLINQKLYLDFFFFFGQVMLNLTVSKFL